MDNATLALQVVNLLGKASKQPTQLGKFLSDFSDATIRWIRPLFLIDEKEDEDFATFKADPENTETVDSKDIIVAKIKKALNNSAEMQQEFKTLLGNMNENKTTSFVNNITGNKNTVIQGSNGNTININTQ
jgi:hypothetical protein